LKSHNLELLLFSTAIGIFATFAAPWYELRGTYAAWRIVEWHTFWRGDSAFQLASVVAENFQVPIEYATAEMQNTLRNIFVFGSAVGAWHLIVLIVLFALGARWRLRSGVAMPRVALEIAGLLIINAVVLYALSVVLALPSSLTPKVDFRTATDIHTNSLIWSELNIFPVAPAFACIAIPWQIFALNGIRTALRADDRR
jgi:hypothetical protein